MKGDVEEIAEYPRPDEAPRDGIAEDDNAIPMWFQVTFAGTIVFAIFYIPYYLFSGWSQIGQYEEQVVLAEARAAEVRASMPSANPYHDDGTAVAEGKVVFDQICAVCHQASGAGLVGPSLVDPYWKYGSDDESVFASVHDGRPLGMPPWGAQLGADKIWKVMAYMESLPKSSDPGVGAPDYQPPSPDGG